MPDTLIMSISPLVDHLKDLMAEILALHASTSSIPQVTLDKTMSLCFAIELEINGGNGLELTIEDEEKLWDIAMNIWVGCTFCGCWPKNNFLYKHHFQFIQDVSLTLYQHQEAGKQQEASDTLYSLGKTIFNLVQDDQLCTTSDINSYISFLCKSTSLWNDLGETSKSMECLSLAIQYADRLSHMIFDDTSASSAILHDVAYEKYILQLFHVYITVAAEFTAPSQQHSSVAKNMLARAIQLSQLDSLDADVVRTMLSFISEVELQHAKHALQHGDSALASMLLASASRHQKDGNADENQQAQLATASAQVHLQQNNAALAVKVLQECYDTSSDRHLHAMKQRLNHSLRSNGEHGDLFRLDEFDAICIRAFLANNDAEAAVHHLNLLYSLGDASVISKRSISFKKEFFKAWADHFTAILDKVDALYSTSHVFPLPHPSNDAKNNTMPSNLDHAAFQRLHHVLRHAMMTVFSQLYEAQELFEMVVRALFFERERAGMCSAFVVRQRPPVGDSTGNGHALTAIHRRENDASLTPRYELMLSFFALHNACASICGNPSLLQEFNHVMCALGMSSFENGHLSMATKFFTCVHAYACIGEDRPFAYTTSVIIAGCLARRGQFSEAIEYLSVARSLLEKNTRDFDFNNTDGNTSNVLGPHQQTSTFVPTIVLSLAGDHSSSELLCLGMNIAPQTVALMLHLYCLIMQQNTLTTAASVPAAASATKERNKIKGMLDELSSIQSSSGQSAAAITATIVEFVVEVAGNQSDSMVHCRIQLEIFSWALKELLKTNVKDTLDKNIVKSIRCMMMRLLRMIQCLHVVQDDAFACAVDIARFLDKKTIPNVMDSGSIACSFSIVAAKACTAGAYEQCISMANSLQRLFKEILNSKNSEKDDEIIHHVKLAFCQLCIDGANSLVFSSSRRKPSQRRMDNTQSPSKRGSVASRAVQLLKHCEKSIKQLHLCVEETSMLLCKWHTAYLLAVQLDPKALPHAGDAGGLDTLIKEWHEVICGCIDLTCQLDCIQALVRYSVQHQVLHAAFELLVECTKKRTDPVPDGGKGERNEQGSISATSRVVMSIAMFHKIMETTARVIPPDTLGMIGRTVHDMLTSASLSTYEKESKKKEDSDSDGTELMDSIGWLSGTLYNRACTFTRDFAVSSHPQDILVVFELSIALSQFLDGYSQYDELRKDVHDHAVHEMEGLKATIEEIKKAENAVIENHGSLIKMNGEKDFCLLDVEMVEKEAVALEMVDGYEMDMGNQAYCDETTASSPHHRTNDTEAAIVPVASSMELQSQMKPSDGTSSKMTEKFDQKKDGRGKKRKGLAGLTKGWLTSVYAAQKKGAQKKKSEL